MLVEGNLPAEEAAGLHRHVDGCDTCRALLVALAPAGRADMGGRAVTGPHDAPRLADTKPAALLNGRRIDWQPGAIVGGRYQLERILGAGGMGVVWAARHRHTRRPAALKFLRDSRSASPQALRRFLREARTPSLVLHPNVLEVQDTIELDDGTPVLVMELLTGESLRARLQRTPRIALAELARLMIPVISAVGTAHAVGVIHRDLKPDNLFLVRLPDGRQDVKVLDFGLAKLTNLAADLAQSGDLTFSGEVLGTPYYMAPEQAFGEHVDHRADIWSLGVILYECLSGERPFLGANRGQVMKRIATSAPTPLAALVPEVPSDVAELVGRILSPERDARPGDLREVAAVLNRYADAAAPRFPGAVPEGGAGRRLGDARWFGWGLAAAALLAAAIGGWRLVPRDVPPPAVIPLLPTSPAPVLFDLAEPPAAPAEPAVPQVAVAPPPPKQHPRPALRRLPRVEASSLAPPPAPPAAPPNKPPRVLRADEL